MNLKHLFALLQQHSSSQRERSFASENATTILPGEGITGKRLEKLMSHKHISHKSGTLARAIINFFHYPVDCHQENLDDGALQASLARVTSRILAVNPKRIYLMAEEQLTAELTRLLPPGRRVAFIRLRDILIPVTTRIFYWLLFGEPVRKI